MRARFFCLFSWTEKYRKRHCWRYFGSISSLIKFGKEYQSPTIMNWGLQYSVVLSRIFAKTHLSFSKSLISLKRTFHTQNEMYKSCTYRVPSFSNFSLKPKVVMPDSFSNRSISDWNEIRKIDFKIDFWMINLIDSFKNGLWKNWKIEEIEYWNLYNKIHSEAFWGQVTETRQQKRPKNWEKIGFSIF